MTDAPWNAFATPFIGKAVRRVSQLAHHGGSALPGRVAEIIDPGFMARTLSHLPLGVVLVSGTNGKTTTTRMVASMLADMGLKVFTNPTGSNFTRGVASALLQQVNLAGKLDADVAVLELDEAYAVHFVAQVRPRQTLLLNVLRDQLDRFGEIDNTARMLGKAAAATSGTVVLNREDPRIASLAALVQSGVRVSYFGLNESLRSRFPSDDDMSTTVSVQERHAAHEDSEADEVHRLNVENGHPTADVTLTAVGDHTASFLIDGEVHDVSMRLEGVYNLYNAAAAMAVVRAVERDAQNPGTAGTDHDRIRVFAEAGTEVVLDALSKVTPAFGRGEIIDVHGSPTELLLVKNPMGFRLALTSFDATHADTMIVINDEYADGRDMSWLWDVDFTSLSGGVAMVSGVRAWDMALRLGYDGVPIGHVEPDIDKAVHAFVADNPGRRKHIYCTYTAMLQVRTSLSGITDVSDAGVR